MGFQLSGLYFFGSGERRATTWGSDLRNDRGASYQILTPAGSTAASLGAVCGCTVEGQTLATVRSCSTALTSWASRSIASTCGSRNGCRLAAGEPRRAWLKCSTCSITRTIGSYTTHEAAARLRQAVVQRQRSPFSRASAAGVPVRVLEAQAIQGDTYAVSHVRRDLRGPVVVSRTRRTNANTKETKGTKATKDGNQIGFRVRRDLRDLRVCSFKLSGRSSSPAS